MQLGDRREIRIASLADQMAISPPSPELESCFIGSVRKFMYNFAGPFQA
jgi:hypothetical protein